MRKLLLVGVILMASFLSRAEEPEKGVRFLDNVAWSEVVKQAKEAGKMIFVDCYTTWCGPCKMLASDVFPREDVGALINEHFVSVKYDVERGEGLAFAKEHRELINAYPTLLMFTTDGELYHRMVGYYPAESMLRALRVRLSGQTPESLGKEYDAGRRDYDFIMTYLDVLVTAEQMEKYAEVKRDYVRSFPLDSLLNPQVWEIAESINLGRQSSAGNWDATVTDAAAIPFPNTYFRLIFSQSAPLRTRTIEPSATRSSVLQTRTLVLSSCLPFLISYMFIFCFNSWL